MKKKISLLITLVMMLNVICSLFTPVGVVAATDGVYFLAQATGNGSGSDWNNAKALSASAFTSALASNTNVYIGSGTYNGMALTISSSGSASQYKNIVGVDTGAGKPVFQGNNSGNAFTVSQSTNYIKIDNFRLNNYSYGIRTRGRNTGLYIGNLDVWYAVQSISLDGGGSASDSYKISDVTVEDCTFMWYSKDGVRTCNRAENVIIKNCYADSGYEEGATYWETYRGVDRYSGNYWPVGFRQTTGASVGEKNIIYVDCIAKGSYCPVKKDDGVTEGYWNGDGFCGERGSDSSVYLRCYSYGATDGGWDSKGTNLTLIDCIAQDNKKNYRFWGSATLTNCLSLYAYKRGGSSAAEGLWISGAGTKVDVYNSTFYNNGGTTCDSGGGELSFTNCIFQTTGTMFAGQSYMKFTDCVQYTSNAQSGITGVSSRSDYFYGDSTKMNSSVHGKDKGYYYDANHLSTLPPSPDPNATQAPTPVPTPTPTPLPSDITVLYDENFQSISGTLYQNGWVGTDTSSTDDLFLKSDDTKYMTMRCQHGAFYTRFDKGVALKEGITANNNLITQLGANAVITATYRICALDYSATSSANNTLWGVGRYSDVTFATAVGTNPKKIGSAYVYALTPNESALADGTVIADTSNYKAWHKIKVEIKVTNDVAEYITPTVDVSYYDGLAGRWIKSVSGKSLLNDVDVLDAFIIRSSASTAKMAVDDINVTLTYDDEVNKDYLYTAIEEARGYHDEISLDGIHSEADLTALALKIAEAEEVYASSESQAEVNSMTKVLNELVESLKTPFGDVNGSGVADSSDITTLMQYVAGWSVSVNESAADVNGDGLVNSADVTILTQYVAGWTI